MKKYYYLRWTIKAYMFLMTIANIVIMYFYYRYSYNYIEYIGKYKNFITMLNLLYVGLLIFYKDDKKEFSERKLFIR